MTVDVTAECLSCGQTHTIEYIVRQDVDRSDIPLTIRAACDNCDYATGHRTVSVGSIEAEQPAEGSGSESNE